MRMLVVANDAASDVGRDVERFRPEPVERWTIDRVVGNAPHTGAPFGAGFGQQQRRCLGEHEPGLAVARLRRLLLVDEQAAALHQVDHERDRLELQLQVLAAPPDRARAGARRPPRAAGTAVFSAVKVNGWNFTSSRPANCAVSRSACA